MSRNSLPKTFSGDNAATAPDEFIDGFLDAQAALDAADFQRGLAYSEYLRTGGASEPLAAAPAAPRTRQRKPTVAQVIRQMQRAGVDIAGVEINSRDGTVKVVSGKPVEMRADEPNEWDTVQ